MSIHQQPVALVTGSSRGLGRMTAEILAENGWDIAVHYHRRAEKGWEVKKRVQRMGGQAEVFRADLNRSDEARRLVLQTVEHFGRLDALIHAVGPFERTRRHFTDYTEEEVEAMVDGNLKSALWVTHAALPHLREQQAGRIILFGFGRAAEAPAWPDRAAYAAAKTGLVSFMKSLAVEEAPYGITVNMVCPGDIVGDNKEKRIAEVQGQADSETPRGRPGTGEDIARVVRFLCEPESDFITGNTLYITGGLDVIHPVSKAGSSKRE
ncbi:3-ketoacyl-ACP reductase [Marinithermofilum abyssi]|uniref:3-ketoacyl-ACP reductase n=1 Tax=Marinithermofilum abyssi TaxID=1571185 RepID=A0A8J2Y8P3_9BACL|nr:SDR family oxidoreductase [Marinithermofilum abyssi]GGE07039.1 3-ketoacyl-ACP reductase [Marinithermofilum abyssi]